MLEDGVVVGDLIRGSDRKWYMNWDETKEGDTQKFLITFDMNNGTIIVNGGLKGDANADGTVDIADVTYILTLMANNAFDARSDVNGDGVIDIADVTNVLTIMANQ